VITPLAQRAQAGQPDTQPIAIEERDQHGVPRLRG
jgi:HemY protein